MRILHTSDWHIGRTFHGHSTLVHLRRVLDALVDQVRSRGIDVVVVAGDIFDSATPSAECYSVLSSALRGLRDAGVVVILTSGNHDSATRLGFQAEFAGLAGIHVLTRPDQHDQPVVLTDEHGPVAFYGIAYLEPALVRHLYPEAELRSHARVIDFAMDRVRADIRVRGARSVVLSHCFAANIPASDPTVDADAGASGRVPADDVAVMAASDVERDITSGGLDLVPVGAFDGPDYVALGHIHGRATLSDRVRYSGAPLHYSFGEANKPRGSWIVDLDASGLAAVEWLDLPVPRRLSVLTGTLDELLMDPAHDDRRDDWVFAVLTDRVRPLDGMRRLQERFPWCAALEHRPSVTAESNDTTYRERVRAKSDTEIVAGFLEHVRNGVGPSEYERDLIADVLAEQVAKENAA
ncbi:exonuclease SbcCD subunit D [Planctomonas psychrotolerans]|uniref:exonuclease SbcCD subunit D n=1 Tax=Planctomonas psychrotolerans TaxID=2528712 RepID=UPI00123C4CFA|nr:exonuclease SbcCD subunit D [Planctomonas psychrotolerans]